MLQQESTSFGSDYETTLTQPDDLFRERTRNDPENFITGAFAGTQLIGSCGGLREDSVKRRHIGIIWGMYLDPDHRGSGLAKRMLEATIKRLKAIQGLEQIQLSVTAGNLAATRLYESVGFVEYGREPAALKVAGRNYDELLMSLPLN